MITPEKNVVCGSMDFTLVRAVGWMESDMGRDRKGRRERRKSLHYGPDPQLRAGEDGNGKHGLRIVWLEGKTGVLYYAVVCAYVQ